MSKILRCANTLSRTNGSRRSSSFISEHVAAFDNQAAADTAEAWGWARLLVAIPAGLVLGYSLFVDTKETEAIEWVPFQQSGKAEFPWGREALIHSRKVGDSIEYTQDSTKNEHFITAFIRRYQEKNLKQDWKVQMEHLEANHQKMMEHIEKKKFPNVRRYASYADLFAHPTFDTRDKNMHLPRGLDD